MDKYGWWCVKFDITLDGEEVRFEDLSEISQEHIAECIKEGYCQGDIYECWDDYEGEEEMEESDVISAQILMSLFNLKK